MAMPAQSEPGEPKPAEPGGPVPGAWPAASGAPVNGHGAAAHYGAGVPLAHDDGRARLNGHAELGPDAPDNDDELATSTADQVNTRARGANGQYRRDIDHVRRDARAAKLAAQGWTFQAIADKLGYNGKGAAWTAIQKVLVETARAEGGLEELRIKQLAELAELRRIMWATVENPPPLVDKQGNAARDADGNPVPDAAAQSQAAMVVIKAGERAARLRGLDAARKTVSAVIDIPAADLEARIAELRREIAGEIAPGPPMIAGTVEPPAPEAP